MSYEFDRYGRPIGRAIGSAMDAIGGLFSRDPEVQAQVDEAKRQRMMALPDDHPNKIHFLSQQRQMTPIPQVPNLNDLKNRMNQMDRSNLKNELQSVHTPHIGGSPIPTMPNKYNDRSNPPTQGIGTPMGQIQNNPRMVSKPPDIPLRRAPSKWDLMKEGMFAGEDQRGLFGKAGIDPNDPKKRDRGSMGLSGFFGDLFNDPARMAMLSGGLTMLDPSSYYDKEGFGSPWTGLKSGLGGAQTGYKSVINRRKALAETEKLRAETISGGDDKRLMSVRGGVLDRKIYGNAMKRGVDPGEARDLAFLATDIESASKFSANQLEKMEGDYYTDQYALSMINETLKILEPYDVTAWADIQVFGEDVGSKLGFTVPRSSSKKVRDNMQALLARLTEMKLGMNLSTRLLDTQGEKQWLAKITSQPSNFGSNYGKIKKDLKDLKNVLESLQGNRKKHNKILSGISGDTGADTSKVMKGGKMTLDEFIAQED